MRIRTKQASSSNCMGDLSRPPQGRFGIGAASRLEPLRLGMATTLTTKWDIEFSLLNLNPKLHSSANSLRVVVLHGIAIVRIEYSGIRRKLRSSELEIARRMRNADFGSKP